jgi:hypothetical protein
MAINPNLLVAAPMLQDYFVDKDTGMPLANGLVTLYIDTSRSFLKNWYYQTGQPGAYTFVPLDNPLHLSSVGTIQDPNGNDVIPFFYPFDEDNQNIPQAYYITVYSVDENGDQNVLQFTRENFPYQPSNVSPTVQNPTWRNYILNNVYWRNIGSQNLTNVTSMVIAPSQHEGYTYGSDIQFIKNITGSNDALSFPAMTTQLDDDITPEFCLNMQASSVTGGETLKAIQYPISLHVNTLASVPGTIKIHAQNLLGNPNNYLDLYFYQYYGTGALSQPAPFFIQRIILNNDFTEFLVPFITPPAVNSTLLGGGGDDALFLLVQYPLSATYNISHTKPQIYLSSDVPDNDFDTYDQIETIINSPRTGDYRHSLNAFLPGWCPANDGTIGSASSASLTRANQDTWPLYNLLWNSILNIWAPVQGGRGSSAIADFNANKPIALTENLGRVIAGLNPLFNAGVGFTGSSATSILTLATSTTLTRGTPVQVTNSGGALPSPLTAGTIYFISATNLTGTTVSLSATLESAYSGTFITLTTNGSGTNTLYPALGAYQGESNHTLTISEMPSHNHPGSSAVGPGSNNDTGDGHFEGQSQTNTTYPITLTIASQGGGAGHNTIQPTAYANVFLKL